MKLRTALMVPVLVVLCAQAVPADPSRQPLENSRTINHAFTTGEKLTYSISWSNLVKAGIAVMEVSSCTTTDNRPAYLLTSRTHSVGVLDMVYPVKDLVESVVDAEDLSSLQFKLTERHGERRREREMDFDPQHGTVKVSVNNGTPEIFPVPPRVQDAFSSLYYVRTRQDFLIGKPILIAVHDDEKTWSVEVQTMGREKIKTPAGEFDTIKIKTYPRYEGVFMHRGEIFIWLTDDARKIPVLMQSKISIGSIMATLTDIQGRQDKP